MSGWRWLACGLCLVVLCIGTVFWYVNGRDAAEPSRLAFSEHCAGCHGAALGGSDLGPDLTGTLINGSSTPALIASIAAHQPTFDVGRSMTKALALYVSEQRQKIPSIVDSHIRQLPHGLVETQHHSFRVQVVAEFDSGPYAIEPLPDGRVLVTEKVRGLSIIGVDGRQGPLVENAPTVWAELMRLRGSYIGLGMMLDVELHPDYASNGWVYLSHSDRCQFDCGSLWPVSMVRVVRGRVVHGRWTDEQVIWSVHKDNYTVVPDGVAAGRLAFDKDGHVFVTVGGKSTYDHLHVMDTPYGKIHRVRDDGGIPQDNPFWQPVGSLPPTSTRHTVWSYGHRTTQGLTTHPQTGHIWASEMGPRGGDEINRVVAGGNYGWPLYTNGLDYDAQPITIGRDLGLDFPLSATIAPVVDFTPAPSLSNLTFYRGAGFPRWHNDLLIGSLRAQTLFRVRVRDETVVEIEKLITRLGRIRDVETSTDGSVYVLLEHGRGGSLVKLVPCADCR